MLRMQNCWFSYQKTRARYLMKHVLKNSQSQTCTRNETTSNLYKFSSISSELSLENRGRDRNRFVLKRIFQVKILTVIFPMMFLKILFKISIKVLWSFNLCSLRQTQSCIFSRHSSTTFDIFFLLGFWLIQFQPLKFNHLCFLVFFRLSLWQQYRSHWIVRMSDERFLRLKRFCLSDRDVVFWVDQHIGSGWLETTRFRS